MRSEPTGDPGSLDPSLPFAEYNGLDRFFLALAEIKMKRSTLLFMSMS
jgi:hypothetical protein